MDKVTYALCKKIASSALSGVEEYGIDGQSLIITTKDGETLTMDFPTPEDGRGIEFIDFDEDNHLIIHYTDGVVDDKGAIKGQKGDTGERGSDGITPEISVLENTDDSYKIKIKVGTEEIETPNLIGPSGEDGVDGDNAPIIEGNLNVTTAVGGIKAGTSYEDGTLLSDILRDMLNPVVYPTFTNPSATIKASKSTILEAGSTSNVTFTVTFNRGSISPANGTSGYRSGIATSYKLNSGEAQANNSFTEIVSSTNKVFKATVNYEAGEQPKDSIGRNYGDSLASGSVNSNTITFEFVNPIWSNTTDITTIAKDGLLSNSVKTKTFVFPAQTDVYAETFDVPATWTINTIEVLNELTNKYDNCKSEFTVSNVTHEAPDGTIINYKRYTDNRGYASASRTIKITWS